MPSNPTTPVASTFPTTSARTVNGVTHIDLAFAAEIGKGSGSIFVTDGAVQTVIDRATGQPVLRVVGASFTREISLDQVQVSGTHVLFDATGLPPGANLNVYMGAGTLLSGGKAYGAITAPGSAAFSTPAAEAPAGLEATIGVEDRTLKAGADIKLTVSFSKAVTSLPAAAISAEHAAIKHVEHSADNLTWTITLGVDDSVESPSNVLRLDMGQVVAADGTRGSGTLASAPYAVDTIVDAWLLPYLGIDDTGPFSDDGVTNEDRQFVSGLLVGDRPDDEYLELRINGRLVDQALVKWVEVEDGWLWYYDADDEAGDAPRFREGADNTISARIVKTDGHSSASVTRTVTVDTDAPAVVTAFTAPVDLSKPIVIGFDQATYWEDNVEVSQDIEVVDEFGNTSWIALHAGMLSADRKTLTLNPGEHDLATGNTYRFTLPSGLTDLAGNEVGGPAIQFETAGPYQDKAPPRLLQTYIVAGDGIYGKGQTLEFRLRYSEKVNLDAGTTLVLHLNNGKAANYQGLSGDGKEMLFTYTIGDGDDIASLDTWRVEAVVGHVRDDAGNVLQNSHIEYDGSLSTRAGDAARVEIDTRVATPGTPQLHADSDSGTVGDGITTDSTPRLTGSGAEAGATVTLYGGDLKIGTATVDASGHWDTVVNIELGAGTHQIMALQTDRAGNVSALSTPLALSIAAPVPSSLPAPKLASLSDTGVSDSDGLTSSNTPAIGGTGPASTTLTLVLDGADLATVDTDASGNWHYVPTAPLADGIHSFSLRLGASAVSPSLSVTVDRTRPTLDASPDGLTGFDPSSKLVISFSEAVHIAAAEGEAGMLVLRDADNNLRRIALSEAMLSSDRRTLTLDAASHGLEQFKSYQVQLPATLTDLAGNPMDEYEIRFSTGNSVPPSVTRTIVGGDHTFRAGETIDFRILFNETIERHGAGELSLGLSNGARAVFTGIVGNEARFSYTVAAGDDKQGVTVVTSTLAGNIADLSGNVLDAEHVVFGDLVDAAGEGSWIDIDTVAPSALYAPQLAEDTGISDSDGITREIYNGLKGSGAEPFTEVRIMRGTTIVGAGASDGEGNWHVSFSAPLEAGEHSYTVRQVDAAGNLGPESSPVRFTVDRSGPESAPPAPLLAAASDTGASDHDGITRDNTPTFTGIGALANSEVALFMNEHEVGRTVTDALGAWSITIGEDDALPDGYYSVGLQQFDTAGNKSPYSASYGLRIDTAAASAPGRPQLAASSDSGISSSDGITRITTPTFSGTGAQADATIVLFAGEREIGRTTADQSGHWDLTVRDADRLAEGSYAITARQIDLAGNTSDASNAFSLIIDTTGPQLSSATTNRSVREFQLAFNEKISFVAGGSFELKDSLGLLSLYKGDSSNWYTSSGAGGADSVLNMKISLTGLFSLTMNNDAIQDVAGNVALIGTREWLVDLLDGPSS